MRSISDSIDIPMDDLENVLGIVDVLEHSLDVREREVEGFLNINSPYSRLSTVGKIDKITHRSIVLWVSNPIT